MKSETKWFEKPLGDVTRNHDGRRKPVKESERRKGPYPYYGASGIVDYVAGHLFDGRYLLVAEDGENLRTRQTPIAFMADGKFWVNNHAHVVTGNEEVMTEYLHYFLQHADIQSYLSGAVMPKLTQGNLNKIPVRYPELACQKQIVKILSSLDRKIDSNRALNQTLEAMAQAIFKSWFVDFDPVKAKITAIEQGQDPLRAAMSAISGKADAELDQMPREHHDQLAATAALFPESVESSELGEVPKGWEEKSLDQIATYLNGLALQKFPPESEDDYLPVIKIAQLRAGHASRADRASTKIEPEYIVQDGDVLFSWSGSLEVDVWTGGAGALNQHLFKITSENVPKWFYYFATKYYLAQFREIAADKATTMGHIQRKHLSRARIAVPKPDVMRRASENISPVLNQIISLRLQSGKLVGLRDALLPKLLSGELVIDKVGALVDTTGAI